MHHIYISFNVHLTKRFALSFVLYLLLFQLSSGLDSTLRRFLGSLVNQILLIRAHIGLAWLDSQIV